MSETKNLKLFKHDNPSTNTNQFDVEKSLNQNWDKIDTEIGNIRENINGNDTDITDLKSKVTDLETNLETAQNNIDEIKQEQITQNGDIEANTTAIEKNTESIEQNTTDITKLKEENAMLKLQIPKGQASGEEISLSDSAEMELTNFELQGNSKQDGEPTLENPVEVEAVGDNINLFDKDNPNRVWGIGISEAEGSLFARGDMCFYPILVEGRTNLTISFNKIYTGNRNCAFSNTIPSSATEIVYGNTTFASTSTGFVSKTVVNNGYKYLLVALQTNDSLDTLKVEPGTVATSYSPYNKANIDIVHNNKNFLNLPDLTYTQNGVTIEVTKGNHFKISGTANGSFTKTLYDKTVLEKLNIIAYNKYPVTLSRNTTDSFPFELDFMSATSGYYMQLILNKTQVTQNILSETFTGIKFYIGFNDGRKLDYEFDLQLEISNQATDIIEPEGNTYTLPIQKPFYKLVSDSEYGTIVDKFIKQDGKWYEQHFIKELILTGEENWLKGSNLYPTYHIIVSDTINELSGEEELGLCNYFKIYKTVFGVDVVGLEFLNIYTSQFSFRINLGSGSEITTVEAWKAKVQELYNAGTPIKLYYVLETPELIECTEEQTQILEQIIKDGTYKEVTHFYTTEDLKPTMQVKYYKDLETLFNKQAELESTLNNVQAQLLELGGN